VQEDDLQSTFPLEDSQPFTEYSFRVRCHCGYEENVMSDWSSVFSVRTPPAGQRKTHIIHSFRTLMQKCTHLLLIYFYTAAEYSCQC